MSTAPSRTAAEKFHENSSLSPMNIHTRPPWEFEDAACCAYVLSPLAFCSLCACIPWRIPVMSNPHTMLGCAAARGTQTNRETLRIVERLPAGDFNDYIAWGLEYIYCLSLSQKPRLHESARAWGAWTNSVRGVLCCELLNMAQRGREVVYSMKRGPILYNLLFVKWHTICRKLSPKINDSDLFSGFRLARVYSSKSMILLIYFLV